jgi:transposase
MAQADNRNRLSYLYDRGYTSAVALQQITGIPKSTVYDVLSRIKAELPMYHLPGGGRPSLLDGTYRRCIVQTALKNPLISAEEIRDKAVLRGCPEVSSRTIQRCLSSSGIFKMVPKPVLALTPEQKQKRVLFCDQHIADDFSTTFFTDESSFLFERHRCPRWSARKPYEIPTSKFGKSIMIWGGISTMGPTSVAVIQGTVDQYKYQDILQEHLLGVVDACYGDNWRFQQDNATPHKARSTQKWLQAHVPSILQWPPNSADLSPIENVWPLLKRNLEKETPKISSIFELQWSRNGMTWTLQC